MLVFDEGKKNQPGAGGCDSSSHWSRGTGGQSSFLQEGPGGFISAVRRAPAKPPQAKATKPRTKEPFVDFPIAFCDCSVVFPALTLLPLLVNTAACTFLLFFFSLLKNIKSGSEALP